MVHLVQPYARNQAAYRLLISGSIYTDWICKVWSLIYFFTLYSRLRQAQNSLLLSYFSHSFRLADTPDIESRQMHSCPFY